MASNWFILLITFLVSLFLGFAHGTAFQDLRAKTKRTPPVKSALTGGLAFFSATGKDPRSARVTLSAPRYRDAMFVCS